MKFRRANLDTHTGDPLVRYAMIGADNEPAIGATSRGVYVEGYWPQFYRWQDLQDFMMRLRIAWEHHEHIQRTKSPVLDQELADGGQFPMLTEPEVEQTALAVLEQQWIKAHPPAQEAGKK